jgi:ketosteroid isomerase-like protein
MESTMEMLRVGRVIKRVASPLAALTLAACGAGVPHDTSADRAGIRNAALAWKAAFNAGDAAAVSALYAQDATLSPPGAPLVRGRPAIAEYFAAKVAEFSGAGLTVSDAPLGEVSVSGDLGFQWETYRITDKSGAVVDTGRLLTLLRREGGKWLIVGDTWNSNTAPGSRPAAAGGDTQSQ